MSDTLAVIEPEDAQPSPQSLGLFGASDPIAVIGQASRVAVALAKVIKAQGLYTLIGSKEHVHVEGWTLLGSMLGVFPRVIWTRKLEDGWEARVEAVVAATGVVIGAGEAQCVRAEHTWKGRDDFALRGMAQTRAISRALRGPLGFVVVLAGFAATPADEMTHDEGTAPPQPLSRASSIAPPPSSRTPEQVFNDARAKAGPAAPPPVYDDTDAVCARCGRKEALRPRGNPRFCAKSEGGCGAPERGGVLVLVSAGQFRERSGK